MGNDNQNNIESTITKGDNLESSHPLVGRLSYKETKKKVENEWDYERESLGGFW